MRWLAGVIAIALGLAAAPVSAQFGAGANPPPEDGGTSPWIRKPAEPKGDTDRDHDRDRKRGHRRDGRFRVFIPHPYYYPYDRDDAATPPAEPAEPPEPVTPPEPQAPPDPLGPLNRSLARGAAAPEPPWQLGHPLPAGLPHVTLDWRRYDLPEPPAGRLYARVGRDVLVITAAGRVVERVMPRE
ncbi:MAG TPA: RcnB family protein [Thermohalobaculum sp.]|nr:RcnB family protein [Thermohalobaculum sp.]